MGLLLLMWAAFICSSIAIIAISRREKLKSFPGPWLASYTDLWAVWYMNSTVQDEPFRKLHAKFGHIVRIGPNKLAFATWNAAKDILSVSRNLPKSDLYTVLASSEDGYLLTNFFSTTDMKYHDSVRRLINRAFSPAAAAEHDPIIDKTVDTLIEELELRYASKIGPEGVFDLAKWAQNFSVDCLGQIGFSVNFSYLKTNSDHLHFIKDNNFFLRYCHVIGESLFLDRLLLKNPLLLWLNRFGIATYLPRGIVWSFKKQLARESELRDGEIPRTDLLDKFLQIKNANPETMNQKEVSKTLVTVVFGGTDTTSWLLSATIRYLLKNPAAYSKLQKEIDSISEFSYNQSSKAPYLDAVIKETARMFPVARFSFERLTPPEGMIIDGHQIPGGVKVGVNTWPVNHDPSIWGNDHESFNPDRWLVEPSVHRAMVTKLTLFGMGKFQCIGKHIAYSELYKAIPRLLKAFRFELANPMDDWIWLQGELVAIQNLNVKITTRYE